MANQYLNKTGLSRLVYKIKTLIQDMSKEAYLVWGGKNVAGDVSPVDAAACDDTNANRLAFHPADCIDVEYSTDGGSTWLDYEATDVNKTTFVTTLNYFYIGKKSASKATINDKLRITLTAKDNRHYWHCQKLLMWISTSGANDCKVLVETRHINETSFSQYGEYNLLGWGGWNSIPFSAYFSANTNTGHVHKVRLTFSVGSVSGDYNSNLSIGKLRMIAPTCYLNANGELGLNGRIYSLSADKSVTFPNKVTATSFEGATATSTSSGLMSAADKKNLDELPTTKISSSATSKGVKVSLGGTVNSPTINIETTTNGVAANNSGVVSGAEVKNYVDNNAASKETFKAQTSSSNAVNGLVPAPSTANTQKYLRGDGTWQTPVSVINNLESTSTTGALSAAQGKKLNEKFGVGVYDLGAFYNYGYSETYPSNGCLIEIGEVASATMVTLQITGFAYYKRKPINSIFVFYDWKNNSKVLEITQYGGINLGYPVGNLMVYHYDGKVYAWIKQTSDFNTLSFKLYSNKNNLSPIVTNAAMHTNGVTLLTEIEPESPLSASTESSDGLMESTDKKNLNTIKKWYDNIVGVDEDEVINKWDEIVSFLSGIPEGDTLDGLIEAVKTQVGDLKDDIEDGTVIAQESKTLGHETIGSTTKPIYLTSGVAKPCTYTLGTSVPSDAKFTDNNTTYSFASGTNKFTVTPSGGTAQEVSVTPSITNNVTYSGTLTSGQVAVLDGTAGKIKASGYTIAKSVPSNAVFTDTTYSGMTAEEATSGSSATNRLISPKVLQDKIDSEISAIPVMTGATSTTTGVAGFVPAPASGQQKKYLRGDGLWSNDFLYKSAYNYSNGCLVKTDIGYREIAQCQFVIKGNSYYKTVGIFTFGQFYNYVEPNKESITYGAATMCGFDFGNIYVFHYNNVVYLWFSQPPITAGDDSYMTFEVYVSTQTSQANRVVEITHSQKPTSGATKEITITPVARLGTESVGDAIQPIYLLNGRPKECTYTVQKSVPSNAVFTDTHYTAKNVVSNSASSTANVAASNGDVHINLVENNTCRSGIKIVGSGATQVVSDEWGNITITSDDTNTTYVAMKGATASSAGTMGLVPAPSAQKYTSFLRGDGTWATPTDTTYSAATQSAAGLMSSDDKKKLDGIANSANAYSLPNATSTTLGGVKVGSNITVNSGTISLTKSNVTSALGYTPPTSDTNTTYNVVTSSVAGLAPKIGTAAAATIGTQSTEWVLTSTSGGTPTWRKLPENAFKDTNTTYDARKLVGDYTYDLGSFYSYTNGCLIEIGKSVGSTMVAIHVTGNGYGATKPINSMYQFYDYNTSSGITQGGAICLGASTGDMVVYRYNNKVYAWIKQQQQFQTLSFRLYTNKSELSPVVTNAAAHTSGISNKITISPSGIYAGVNTTTPDWSNSTDARKGIELLQTVGSAPTSGSAPSNYSVGLRVSGYYSFMLANDASNNAMRCYRDSTNGWETFITDKNIGTHKAGDSSKLGGVAAASYATKDDITNGNITAAKATNADSATAIGGKGLSDLVQGGGDIKFIKVVTSLPASPSNDTLYLIKQ